MKLTTVSVIRCPDYDRAQLCRAVREALAALPPESWHRPAGATVLLKPNLLSSHAAPDAAVNTHPEFVRAVAELFLEQGCKVLIGDSCGSLSPGSTAQAICATGLDKVAAELGVELVDFDRAPAEERPIPGGVVLKSVRLPKLLREVDLLVTLPKFKTHGLTLLTGAVKNQLGLVAGNGKKEIHRIAPHPREMSQAMADLYSIVRPGLTIMDAVVGMEGNGPAGGRARRAGLLLASADCVALDAVAADLMGCKPGEVLTTRFADERGLGVGGLDRIQVAGVLLDRARIPDWRKPPLFVRSLLFSILPNRFVRWAFGVVGDACASVLDDRCILCGECIANCPAQAIRKEGGRLKVEQSLCISCYCCSEVCKNRAILMRRPIAGRIVHGLYRLAAGRGRVN